MALWKPYRGSRADLDAVEKHDGYVYFCTDDGSLFFDYTDADDVLQRKQISAKDAETLTGKTIEEIKKSINYNDLINKPTNISAFTNDVGYLTESDNLELITVDDIDAICDTIIQDATASEVTF